MNITTVPAPETDRLTRLTPKGDAARLAYKLGAALRTLSPEDCADCLVIVAEQIRPVIRDLANLP